MLLFLSIVFIIKLLSDHKINLKETLLVIIVAAVWLLACAAVITLFILANVKPR